MEVSEIVRQIQQGDTSLYITLWEAVHDLIAFWAKKYYNALKVLGKVPGGVEVEDLVQCGYCAMVDAVTGYVPEKGAFTTYLGFHIKKEFRRAIGRSDRQLRDKLNRCRSLDAPLNGDTDSTLFDIVADTVQDQYNDFSDIEEKIFNEQLHVALEKALNTLPEKEAAAIRSEYWEGCTLQQIAEKLDVTLSRVHQLRNRGFHIIRHSSARRELEQFIDQNTDYYRGTGVAAHNTRGSQVENLVLRRERLRDQYRKYFEDNPAP